MEQQIDYTNSKDNSQIGSTEFNEFVKILDSLFPDQDLSNPESKYAKKVMLTYRLIKAENWSKAEFYKTMQEFSRKWTYTTWMPANILDFKQRYFPDDKMVM
jgi:hypothetical protein